MAKLWGLDWLNKTTAQMEAEIEAEAAARVAAGLPEFSDEEPGGLEPETRIGARSGFQPPPYQYDFGFNPLIALGELIRAKHPRVRLRRAMTVSRAFRVKRSPGARAVTFAAPGPCSAAATAQAAQAAAAQAATDAAASEILRAAAGATAAACAAAWAAAKGAGCEDHDVGRLIDPRLGDKGRAHAHALRAQVTSLFPKLSSHLIGNLMFSFILFSQCLYSATCSSSFTFSRGVFVSS